MTVLVRSVDFLDPDAGQRTLVAWGHLALVEVDFTSDGGLQRTTGRLYCPMADDNAVILCDVDTHGLDDQPLDELLDGLRQISHRRLRQVRLLGEPKGIAS